MVDISPPAPPRLERTRSPFKPAIHTLFQRKRPAWPIAIMRILFGLVVFGWTATMAVDVGSLLGSDALVPIEFASQGGWNWFALESTGAVWVAIGVLLIASVAITLGWRPTEWLVLTFVLLVAVQRRNPVILNSGDVLLRNFALILAFMPTGAALSLDRWRRHGRGALWTAPNVAPWGLRLIQLQLCVVYFFAFWSKGGDLWHNGTAVSTVFRIDDITRFGSPGWLTTNVVLIGLFTWGTLAIELALTTLLWARRLRPVLIGLGLLLHFFIDVFVLVGFFGPLMMIGLLSFADADWLERRIATRRARPQLA
jgi:hypothetical protein